MAGDLVSARLESNEKGPAASDLRLERRWRRVLFGSLEARKGQDVLAVDEAVANGEWPLSGAPKELDTGTPILATIAGERAHFERVVDPDRYLMERTLARWGVEESFPPELEEAALALAHDAGEGRRDLRQVTTLTIDGASSKDLDDALSVLPPQADGAIRVLISIADVDAAVPEGSPLDVAARARGTTVYLPDGVFPMIPRSLSEDRLSLLPDVDRAAVTVELRIDPDGVVTAADPCLSLIRNHARLTYEGAAAFLDRDEVAGVPEPARQPLRWLRAAASRLGAARKARGGIALQRGEVKLRCEGEGNPTEVVPLRETSAHRLVERLMVAANEAMASWLAARGLPAFYRVQDEPDAERVARLVDYAHNFGFETAFGARITPRGLSAFEEQFQSSAVAPQVRTVLRRVLGRARYQPQPAPHFGLASPGYLHFTSPIRRYADLAVHRVVKAHLAGSRDASLVDTAQSELSDHLNAAAGRARRAETERLRQLLARFYASRLGERCTGHVVSIKARGLIVQLDGLGASGLLPADSLPDGPYRFEREREELRAREGEGRFVVGQALEVVIAATDEDAGSLELKLVE